MTATGDVYGGECVVAGRAMARVVRLNKPLSFWGGFDAERGVIVEPTHPQNGVSLAGCVMLMEKAKGSSSSSSVLAEAIRNGGGPVGIVMRERDLIVALGCIVADELYGKSVPLVTVDAQTWEAFQSLHGRAVEIVCEAGAPARIGIL